MRKQLFSFAQVTKLLKSIKLKGVLTPTPPTPCVRPWLHIRSVCDCGLLLRYESLLFLFCLRWKCKNLNLVPSDATGNVIRARATFDDVISGFVDLVSADAFIPALFEGKCLCFLLTATHVICFRRKSFMTTVPHHRPWLTSSLQFKMRVKRWEVCFCSCWCVYHVFECVYQMMDIFKRDSFIKVS